MATSASVRGPEGGRASVSLAPALFRTEHTEHSPSPSDHTTAPTTHRARARATRARGLATPAHAHTRTTPAQEATPATVGREGEATEGRVEVVVPSEIRRVRLEEPRRLTAACGRETAAVTIHGQPVGIFRWEPEIFQRASGICRRPPLLVGRPGRKFRQFPGIFFQKQRNISMARSGMECLEYSKGNPR